MDNVSEGGKYKKDEGGKVERGKGCEMKGGKDRYKEEASGPVSRHTTKADRGVAASVPESHIQSFIRSC